MMASFHNLKSNAKRRGKPFTITFEDFKTFCYETDYLAGAGRKATSYSIDRKDDRKGYVPGNLQVLTLSDNSRKGKKLLQYDWQTKTAYVTHQRPQDDENLPF